MEFIGGGTFGETWTTKLKGRDPILVKKICRRITDVDSLQMEVLGLCTFDSEYLPDIVYSGYDIDGRWCVIMQYFNGGTLEYHIEEEIKKPKITPAQKKYIAYHFALAIEYLHGRCFTHG